MSKRLLIVLTATLSLATLAALPQIAEKIVSAKPTLSAHRRQNQKSEIIVGASVHNDTSAPLRDMKQLPVELEPEGEANENPPLPVHHKDSPDPVVQRFSFLNDVGTPTMPSPLLNFDGIPFPGVDCNCTPPDTNGEVGTTQYVQIVNKGLQVFDKTTGASLLGPIAIWTLWNGFGGFCQDNGRGDPVVLYDQLANRWVITQFAGDGPASDECIAVSTSSDATGSYHRYDFSLGPNSYDYPHLSVWPDAYYMSANVFGGGYQGPQPFAFDRAKMLNGLPATFVSPGITGGPSEHTYLPADLDGSNLPPVGAPATFVEFPGHGSYRVFHFSADFVTPPNTSFTLFASPAAAGFTGLCFETRACVPQLGSNSNLDGIGDRLMFRLAYRNFGDHESLVGNFSVRAGGVAGIRWFELRGVTSGPVTVFQESTYQPDTTWRWMGSAAMDRQGNLAIGYSASSASIFPQIRYTGRLATDPPGILSQGEATLLSGTGSQTSTFNRWGDYSDLTIDPVDDCTFWYTTEYYSTTSTNNWRTRIGSFKFPGCGGAPTPTPTPTPTASPTPTPTPTPPSPPNAPSNLAGYSVSGNQITVEWKDNSNNEDGFRIERCQGVGCTNFLQIVEIPANITGYKNTGLSPNTQYRYRVRAFNAAGNSGYSNIVTVSTLGQSGPGLEDEFVFALTKSWALPFWVWAWGDG